MREGRLYYVVGPSGVGKDSLLRYARSRLEEEGSVRFARRYITRPLDLDNEDHVALSASEFSARLARGGFLMHWESHGYRYGIGIEIRDWLADGADIVMNGSRQYLPTARRIVTALRPIVITAKAEFVAQRLAARDREDAAAIAARIARAARFADGVPDAAVIENNGPLEEAGERLVALLSGRA